MLYPHSEATLAVLRRAPVIPVLTVRDIEDALAQTRALIAGGLTVIEITLRTPAAMGAVSALRETSVVFAALLGAAFLGERLTGLRIAACCIIAAGAACVGWRL